MFDGKFRKSGSHFGQPEHREAGPFDFKVKCQFRQDIVRFPAKPHLLALTPQTSDHVLRSVGLCGL